MNVLVCGARGFIGRQVVAALQAGGHAVRRGVSRRAASAAADGDVATDFVRDTQAVVWRARLDGIDAVVNAVGVLRDTPLAPIQAVHAAVPIALFEACASCGVRRVVQISALGVDRSATQYARTKLEADRRLLELTEAGRLDGVVLRPSIVYGEGGASAALFDALSRWPLLVLPSVAMRTRIQPLCVEELAQAVAALLTSRRSLKGVVPCVGPRALTVADFIGSLRAQRGHPPARRIAIPDGLARLSARLGDRLPITPWGSETLALLGADNTAEPAPLRALLGHLPADPDHFLAPACPSTRRTAS